MAAWRMIIRLGMFALPVWALLTLGACADTKPTMTDDGKVIVTLAGATFSMELADDGETRYTGLGGRTEIAPDGGMIFIFPASVQRSFVMRDCVIPIDIAYLDDSKRVVSMYTMQPEPPRRENEAEGNYEARLKRYHSRFPARYVLEFRAGTLEKLGVKAGDEARFEARTSRP